MASISDIDLKIPYKFLGFHMHPELNSHFKKRVQVKQVLLGCLPMFLGIVGHIPNR